MGEGCWLRKYPCETSFLSFTSPLLSQSALGRGQVVCLKDSSKRAALLPHEKLILECGRQLGVKHHDGSALRMESAEQPRPTRCKIPRRTGRVITPRLTRLTRTYYICWTGQSCGVQILSVCQCQPTMKDTCHSSASFCIPSREGGILVPAPRGRPPAPPRHVTFSS